MRTPLARLIPYRARKWFTFEFTKIAQLIADTFQVRDEILGGGDTLAAGTVTNIALLLTYSAIQNMLKGRLMADIAALADVDVLAKAGTVEAAIYQDGTAYTGDPITLASDKTALVTLIVTNSDGAGAAVEDDGAAAKLIAIIAGTDPATAILEATYLTSVEIAEALAGSTGVHDGVTAWAHFAEVEWNNPSATPGATVVLNRNNVISDS